jgi:SPP1 family predicted phage head-tail adaptor
MTSIGQLNRRIAIEQQTASQDTFGQPVQTWTQVYECWANIDVQQSQLIYSTAEFISKVTHRITMRWTSSVVIQPNMRAVYTEATTGVTHTYNIEALVNPMQGNVWVAVLCYEVNANE